MIVNRSVCVNGSVIVMIMRVRVIMRMIVGVIMMIVRVAVRRMIVAMSVRMRMVMMARVAMRDPEAVRQTMPQPLPQHPCA